MFLKMAVHWNTEYTLEYRSSYDTFHDIKDFTV